MINCVIIFTIYYKECPYGLPETFYIVRVYLATRVYITKSCGVFTKLIEYSVSSS